MRSSFCASALLGCWLSAIAFGDASELPNSYGELQNLYDNGAMPSYDDFPLEGSVESTRYSYSSQMAPRVGVSVGIKYGPNNSPYWAEGKPGNSAESLRKDLISAIKSFSVSRLLPSPGDEAFKRTDLASAGASSCITENLYRKVVLEGGLELIVYAKSAHGNCVEHVAEPFMYGYFIPLTSGQLVEVTADADVLIDRKSVDKVTVGKKYKVNGVKGKWVRLQKLDEKETLLGGWVWVENLKQLAD